MITARFFCVAETCVCFFDKALLDDSGFSQCANINKNRIGLCGQNLPKTAVIAFV